MGDLVLIQAPAAYDQLKYATMIDILQRRFSNISTVINQALRANYLLTSQTGSASSTGSTEITLMSTNVQPNTIAKAGTKIVIEAFGTFATNANNKQLKLYFGSTVLYTTTSSAANGGIWSFTATVITTGTNTEYTSTNFNSSNVIFTSSINYLMPTEVLSAILNIKVTGKGSSTGDITESGLLITVYPSAT